jgi:hypothetical protein
MFAFLTGFFNNYALQPDSHWLVAFGMEAAKGNFNFELERFIASPLFPVIVGLFKFTFNQDWPIYLIIFQLTISALSGVCLYKIGLMLFDKKNTALIASLIFAVFPMTLWFNHTFSQECLFQAFFIFSVYYLIKSVILRQLRYVIASAIFFSCAYLTKSHILLFSLFIPVIYFYYFRFKIDTIIYSAVFASIALLFSLPYGIYQYKINDVYVISSNGGPYQFYLGNTNAGYKTVVDVPQKKSDDYYKIKDIVKYAGYFNGSQAKYDSMLALKQKDKQSLFAKEAFRWIKDNPLKFIELKVYNLLFFLLPGISWRHYEFHLWLMSFIISMPIYLAAYITMYKWFKEGKPYLIIIMSIFGSMMLFSVVWYVQNRFRTITIEPFYIMLAAEFIANFLEKNQRLHNLLYLLR